MTKRQLLRGSGIILFTVLTIIAEHYMPPTENGWDISKSGRSYGPDSTVQIDSSGIDVIYLSKDNWGEYHPLISRHAIDSGRGQPADMFRLLTVADKKKQKLNPGDSLSIWFVIKVHNVSRDSVWNLMINNAMNHTSIYQRINRANNSLKPLEGYDMERSYGSVYTFQLARYKPDLFLINIRTQETNFAKLVSFWPKAIPVQPKLEKGTVDGLAIGMIILLSGLLIYMMISIRNLIYGVFISYLISAVYIQLSQLNYALYDSDTAHSSLPYEIIFFSRTLLLLFIPYLSFPRLKSLYLAGFLFLSSYMIDKSYFLFSLDIGQHYSSALWFLAGVVYLWFVFQRNEESTVIRRAKLFAVMAVLFPPLFTILTQGKYSLTAKFIYSLIEMVILATPLMLHYISWVKLVRRQELSTAVARQKELSDTVIRTLDEERKRIAQDIHDELGANLALMKMKFQVLSENTVDIQPILNILDETSDSVRNISHKLMPAYFIESELRVLLEEHLTHLNTKEGMRFQFYYAGDTYSFSKEDELMIYRVILELLHNCLKHSAALEVNIQLTYHSSYLEILCEDNGNGFSSGAEKGIGIQSIKSRVFYLGGTINFDSGASGTTIIIQIPYLRSL